jgi:hypothetical protein
MSALRKTRPGERSPRRLWWLGVALLIPVGLFGCGSATPPGPEPDDHAVGANDPAWIVSRPALPPPDADLIKYDERTRTLTMDKLPGNDRWMVRLPGEDVGRPVGTKYRVPDADPAEVMVYYARPGLRPSAAVSVKQIQEWGGAHVSHAAPPH